MNNSGNINITSVLADKPNSEILTTNPDVEVNSNFFHIRIRHINFPQASNTNLPQRDNNNISSSPTASEDKANNPKKIGRAGRVRKGLANVGEWIARKFLERIINNIADATWDSVIKCCDAMTELDGDDNENDEDE